MRHIVALFLVLTLVSSSAPSWAESESTAVEIGAAAGSAFGTMIYAPVKATFCILGGIGSGLTAIVSPPTAGKVAMSTCGGARAGAAHHNAGGGRTHILQKQTQPPQKKRRKRENISKHPRHKKQIAETGGPA